MADRLRTSTRRRLLQVLLPTVDERSVETPSFSFRLEPVRSLRKRAEEREREALFAELRVRAEGETLLRRATDAVSAARASGRGTVTARRVSAVDLITSQAFMERTERVRVEAAHELDRREAEVTARRGTLTAAARDRKAIDTLKERRKAEHDAEWARRSQNTLDELALAVHRRGGAAVA
jgi:flagellar FliJ protein